jgi:adenylate cyclase
MRGQLLILLGRFDEARPYLDRLLQVDAAQRDITSHVACVAYVDLAWAEGDAHLAEAHAAQAIATAVNGSPYEQVHARACRGLSHIVAGRLDSAVEDLAETLSYARRRRAGLEIEARTLALLASAYRLKGDLASGLQAADEAIDVATARRARVPESFARIVRAEILWKMGGAADQIGAEIDRARALMEETGAAIYRPVLDDLVSRRAGGTSTTAKRSSPPDASLAG